MNEPFSQMLPNGDQVVGQLQNDPLIRDVMRNFPEPHAQHLNQRANGGRHMAVRAPPRILRHLHEGLWDSIDWEAHQVADNTRWMWGKEGYDGTKFQFLGVGKPFHAVPPLIRSVAWKDFRPATEDDE